jgi:hypothetical protein
MSATVRRSARSTKGVHSQRDPIEIDLTTNEPSTPATATTSEISSATAPVRARAPAPRKPSQPAYTPVPGETVRCLVCGTTDANYDEDDDPHGMMIQCDDCQTWQHVKCMFGSKERLLNITGKTPKNKKKDITEDDLPDAYKCDVCDPLSDVYVGLRRKLGYARYLKMSLPNNGEEEGVGNGDDNDNDNDSDLEIRDAGALDDLDDDDEYDEGKRKRGASDEELSGDEDNTLAETDNATPEDMAQLRRKMLKKLKKGVQSPDMERDRQRKKVKAEIKDKSGDDRTRSSVSLKPKATPKSKAKSKPSTTPPTPPTTPSFSIETIRPKIIKNFETKLTELLPKTNNESVLQGLTIEEVAQKWAKIIEEGLYKFNKAKYTDRARILLLNLKLSNLVSRVIEGEFTIEQLPTLSKEEMLTAEEKEKAEIAKQKALNQVVLKNDSMNMPKIRITHRGEEIVGDPDYQFDINDQRNKEVERLQELKRKEEEEQMEMDLDNELDDIITRTMNTDYGSDDDGEDDSFVTAATSNSMDADTEHTSNSNLLDDDMFDSIIHDRKKAKEKRKEVSAVKSVPIASAPALKPLKAKRKKSVTINDTPTIFSYEKEEEEADLVDLPPTNDLWHGIIRANDEKFDCNVNFITSTCNNGNKKVIIDRATRIVTEYGSMCDDEFPAIGRLDSSKADPYLEKITHTRDLYLFEIKPMEDNGTIKQESEDKLLKLWSSYYQVSKYAVLKNPLRYVKDCYVMALSREKLIDGEECAIVFSKFSRDDIMEHLENSTNESKLYLMFVVQRDMDSVPSQQRRKDREKENRQVEQAPVAATPIATNNAVVEQEEENDDDYDPALSMTLSKLSGDGSSNGTSDNGGDVKTSPEALLADLMKNLAG